MNAGLGSASPRVEAPGHAAAQLDDASHAAPAAPARVARWPWLLLVVFAALASYSVTLNHPFVWDDHVFITKNPAVTTGLRLGAAFTDPTTLSAEPTYNSRIYRPLRTLAFAALQRVGGGDPFLFHLVLVLLHAAVCALAVLLLLRFGLSLRLAVGAGLLFAVHPVHTEAVSWISSLADPLSTLLLLGAWLAMPPLDDRRGGAVLGRTALAGGLMALALLAKEMTATLPLLLACAWLLQARRRDGGAPWRDAGRAALRLLPLLALVLGYVAARRHVIGTFAQSDVSWGQLGTALVQVPYTFARYLYASVSLFGQSAFHQPVARNAWFWVTTALTLGALVALLLRARRRAAGPGPAALLLALFAVSLAPVLNVLPLWVQFAERFAYLPSFFALAALVVALDAGCRRLLPEAPARRAWVVMLGVLVVAASVQTQRRNWLWGDELRLWEATVRVSPRNATAHLNHGLTLQQRGRYAEAAQALELAFGSPKPAWEIEQQIAQCHLRTGASGRAEQHARRALALARAARDRARARATLGLAEEQQGRREEALRSLSQAIADDPAQVAARADRGRLLVDMGRAEQALPDLTRARELAPGDVRILYQLARAFALLGRCDEARPLLRELRRRAPQDALVRDLGSACPGR